jgi:formylglycine-generating enzyme required for sulfatase activity/predicted Ser/Thr protein kinase
VADNGTRSGATEATLPPDSIAPDEPASPATNELASDSGAETAPSDAGDEVLSVGACVGRYIVVEKLGSGAMGVVYAAYDPKLDRKVALKLLRPRGRGDQARRTARLEREAQAVAKLSHANVVGIFDVLVHEERLVLAMEYLAGGTLTSWLATQKRPWREILTMFVEVGHGLAAAHAEGQIHRDFKPDNVLLDKNGVPKVVDFGLVRMRSTTNAHPIAPASDEADTDDDAPVDDSARLTRTGAIAGTPAYMAPEQFMDGAVDARTDQFAFCVALFEALYGERPFVGNNIVALAESVTAGRVRTLPRNAEVPGWVRACLIRGLAVNPNDRFPDLDELVATLATDPIARRRRRVLAAAAATVVVGGALMTLRYVGAKRREVDQQVAEHVAVANAALAEAAAKRADAKVLRDRAFAAFDGYARDAGEQIWSQGLAATRAADADYKRGIQRLEAAATLEPRRELKDRIADALVDYIQIEGQAPDERDAIRRRLAAYDEDGRRARRLAAPATLRIDTDPARLTVRIENYDAETDQVAGPSRTLGQTPLTLEVAAGSYRLSFDETETHVGFYDPVLLAPGETYQVSVRVPSRTAVPKDFVYVPEGRFLFGSSNEDLRTAFLETAPLHEVHTPAFLIARYETTIGSWIAFLKTLPVSRRELLRPQGRKDGEGGFVDVHETPEGRWEILLRATDQTYRAGEGERFRYSERDRRAAQDWLRFPVSGVSPKGGLEYARWLDQSGKVPHARLCTEREWERAARGADAREFPHGNRLLRDDANFDLTYDRKSGGYGPDEVGSHPASASPFGVDDLVGNVWDVTTSVLDRDQFVARGGSFYQCLKTLWSTNRDPVSSATRDHTIGLRICADVNP